jgi:hypothetical protein
VSDTDYLVVMYDGTKVAEAIERHRLETGESLRAMALKAGIQLRQMFNLATGQSKRVQPKSVRKLRVFPRVYSEIIAKGRKPPRKKDAGFGVTSTR